MRISHLESLAREFLESRPRARPAPLSNAGPADGGVSSVRTFFRHCPSCGRRFEIRLVGKKPAGSQTMAEDEKFVEAPGYGIRGAAVVVEEDQPTIVDVEEFQYAYKCKHCGHQWTEVRERSRSAKAPKGYTGD